MNDFETTLEVILFTIRIEGPFGTINRLQSETNGFKNLYEVLTFK